MDIVGDKMLKNRIVVIFLAMCLILGTLPSALGATTKTSTNSVYISALDIGAPYETANQEYVKITNSGKTSVSMKGWKVTDKDAKHTYKFPSSYTLKSKTTVTIYTGKGKNSATKLYWGRVAHVWNNEGDTAYLYNAQGNLVSARNG
jgi:Intermediate filament tail domain.